MKIAQQITLQACLWTSVNAFAPSNSVKQSVTALQANGLKMDQFSDFYDGIGYTPKTDVGHDGQTFVPLNGRTAAETAGSTPAAPTEMIDERPEDMMAGVFYGFHESVGYKPLWTTGADAQPFAKGADLYEPVEAKAETSVPVGEIAPNGLNKAVYDEFYSGIGYVPRSDDIFADAQKFTPKSQLESYD